MLLSIDKNELEWFKSQGQPDREAFRAEIGHFVVEVQSVPDQGAWKWHIFVGAVLFKQSKGPTHFDRDDAYRSALQQLKTTLSRHIDHIDAELLELNRSSNK